MDVKLENVLKILTEHFQPKPELLQKPSQCSSRITVMKRLGVSMDESQWPARHQNSRYALWETRSERKNLRFLFLSRYWTGEEEDLDVPQNPLNCPSLVIRLVLCHRDTRAVVFQVCGICFGWFLQTQNKGWNHKSHFQPQHDPEPAGTWTLWACARGMNAVVDVWLW